MSENPKILKTREIIWLMNIVQFKFGSYNQR